jgi:hypothetical protein
MRVTGDGGEVSAAAEKQRRMLPRCNVCSPPQPHLPFTTRLFSLAVLAWVVVFVFVGQGPMDFVPCRGRRVGLRAVPYIIFPKKNKNENIIK